jgi:hypothetical protein
MKTAVLFLALLAQGAAQSTARPGVIAGRILRFDGTPAAGVRVAVVEPPAGKTPGALRNFTETDGSGRYRLEEVPPGRYFIIAGPLSAATYFPGVATLEAAMAVTVVSGTAQIDRDFKLAIPLLRLSGRVVRELDPPLRQSVRRDQVALASPGVSNGLIPIPTPQTLTPIGPDDTFEFRNLPPGIYHLGVVGDALQMPGVQVSLNDQDVTGYTLTVPRSAIQASVTVTATVNGGGPTPMFPFQLTPPAPPGARRGGPPRNLTVGSHTIPFNSDNSIAVAGPLILPPGEYSASLGLGSGVGRGGRTGLPEGFSVESVKMGATDLLSEALVLAPGDKAQISIILKVSSPPPGRRVAGRVKSAAGVGAARIGITGSITYIAAVRPDGTFEFPHVFPGRYMVQSFPNGNTAEGATIVGNLLMAGSELTGLEIPASLPSFKVSGRGLGEEELRRQGRIGSFGITAGLSEPARSPTEPPGFQPRGLPPNDQSLAPDGSFQFTGVTPGRYNLSFSSGMGSDVGPLPKPINVTIVDKDIEGLVVQIGPALW